MGCGPQETFINCADISILVNTGTHATQGFNPWAAFFKRAETNQLASETELEHEQELGSSLGEAPVHVATPGISPLPWSDIRARPVVR